MTDWCRKNCSVLIMANACIFYKVFPELSLGSSSLHADSTTTLSLPK
jgi:hypothetical protein